MESFGQKDEYLVRIMYYAHFPGSPFGLLLVAAALPSCFVWLAFGAALQRFLRARRASRIFNIAMGTLLAGSVILFIR